MRERLETARAAAERTVQEARARARHLVNQAAEEGAQAGEADLAAALAELQQAAERILVAARAEAEEIQEDSRSRLPEAVTSAVSFVVKGTT